MGDQAVEIVLVERAQGRHGGGRNALADDAAGCFRSSPCLRTTLVRSVGGGVTSAAALPSPCPSGPWQLARSGEIQQPAALQILGPLAVEGAAGLTTRPCCNHQAAASEAGQHEARREHQGNTTGQAAANRHVLH